MKRSFILAAPDSTAPDYVTFTRMLLARGTFNNVEVLKPETVKPDGA